jgi:GNAT superfamily N-acetyltransferase
MLSLAAQSVQSIGDLFLIRVYNNHAADDDDVGGNHQTIDNVDYGQEYNDAARSIERMPSHEVSSWTRTAARFLQEQWPRQDRDKPQHEHFESQAADHHSNSKNNDHEEDQPHTTSLGLDNDDAYYRKLIVHHDTSYPRYSLACSYILLKHSAQTTSTTKNAHIVLGHGRLTECYESAGGNAAAATYILIDPEHRGKGYGRTLVRLLEQEAKSKERLGCQYHFVYLWCKTTTAPFYERSGYLPCRNRVSLQKPCLKALTATSVQSLEDILQRKRTSAVTVNGNNNNAVISNTKKKLETVVLLPSSSLSSQSKEDNNRNKITGNGEQPVAEEDVWLRKRLVDHVESIHISEQDRRNELQQFVVSTNNTSKVVSSDISTNTIVVAEQKPNLNYWYQYRWNPHIPWQMQIGPSCGLTAIRMIRDFYCYNTNSGSTTPGPSSLLTDARNRGYTDDGEMFDANHLGDLMKDQLLVASTGSLSLNDTTTSSGGSLDAVAVVQTRETSSLTIEEIDSTLRQKGLWILPYDSNQRTKLPGNFQGKHAHWGIVVGILYARTTKPQIAVPVTDASSRIAISTTAEEISDENLAFDNKEPLQNKNLIEENNSNNDQSRLLVIPKPEKIKFTNNGSLPVKKNIAEEDKDDIFGCTTSTTPSDYSIVHLIVQHSLSSKWAIAPMEKWFDSNRQLISVNEDKFALGNGQNLNLKNKIIQVLPST